MAKGAKKPVVRKKIRQTDAFEKALADFRYHPPDPSKARMQLLENIERAWGGGVRVFAYGTNQPFGSIDANDVGPIASVLDGIGRPDALLFVVTSDGGDAYAAEKIVHVCRQHTKRLMVAVPDRAKSAGTIISLGADEIILGYLSELGPIDPQVAVEVSGVPRYVSANSFIEARDILEGRVAMTHQQGGVVLPLLQELSELDYAFIRECERMVAWSKALAIRYLARYLTNKLRKKPIKNRAQAATKAGEIAHDLSTAHLQHGEFIGPNECRALGLDFTRLRRNEKKWALLWDYCVRLSLFFGMPPAEGHTKNTKVIETATSSYASTVTLA